MLLYYRAFQIIITAILENQLVKIVIHKAYALVLKLESDEYQWLRRARMCRRKRSYATGASRVTSKLPIFPQGPSLMLAG